MTAFIVAIFAVALVACSYVFRDYIDAWFPSLKGWRTVIFNAVSAAAILLVDIIGYLAGFSWDSLLSANTAAAVTLALNVANVALRFATNTPVGDKNPVP